MYFWKRTLIIASFVSTTLLAQETSQNSDTIDIKKVSEAFGHFIGRNLKTSGLGFDIDSFIQGIRNGLNDKPSPLTDKEYEHQMMLLQEKAFKRLADENLKSAESFLQKNRNESGVVEITPGKLQYMIVKEGYGPEVKEHQSPQIQYTGKYIDGTVFGNSQDTGGPITIPIDQTIPGFSKGLIGMKEGEIRKIFVHPELGYGKTGHLPPNSLLIFEVELIKADNPSDSMLDLKDDDDLVSDDDDDTGQDDSDDDDADDNDGTKDRDADEKDAYYRASSSK